MEAAPLTLTANGMLSTRGGFKFMKCLLCLIPFALSAQSLIPTLNPPSVAPGGTTTLTYALADSTPSSSISQIQWMTLPSTAGLTFGPPVIGLAATAAGRQLQCGANCVVGRLSTPYSTAAMASGTIVAIQISVASTVVPGVFTIGLGNVYASSITGSNVPIVSPTVALTVTAPVITITCAPHELKSPCSGVISPTDVLIAIQQVLGNTPCTISPTVVASKCTVADIDVIINAIPGMPPASSPAVVHQ